VTACVSRQTTLYCSIVMRIVSLARLIAHAELSSRHHKSIADSGTCARAHFHGRACLASEAAVVYCSAQTWKGHDDRDLSHPIYCLLRPT